MYFETRDSSDTAGGPGNKRQDLETVDLDTFNSVFSLRRPRDLGAGLSSGAKSIAKGVLAGTVSLVGAPVVGAVSGGWGGFAKGVGIGELSVESLIHPRLGYESHRQNSYPR